MLRLHPTTSKGRYLIWLLLFLVGCAADPAAPPAKAPAAPPGPVGGKRLRPAELSQVVAITAKDDARGLTRVTTDPGLISPVVGALAGAAFHGDNRAPVSRGAAGSYILLLRLRDGREVALAFWTGGLSPNLRDMGMREWWAAKGLDQVIKPLLPAPTPAAKYRQPPDDWPEVPRDVLIRGQRPYGHVDFRGGWYDEGKRIYLEFADQNGRCRQVLLGPWPM